MALRPIYHSPTEEAALQALKTFEREWGGCHALCVRTWREIWTELATFFRYPVDIRQIMYTTNIIQGDHRQLRKATKGKSIFPSDEALTKMLYLPTLAVTKKWTKRIANWGQIIGQLSMYFGHPLAPYLA